MNETLEISVAGAELVTPFHRPVPNMSPDVCQDVAGSTFAPTNVAAYMRRVQGCQIGQETTNGVATVRGSNPGIIHNRHAAKSLVVVKKVVCRRRCAIPRHCERTGRTESRPVQTIKVKARRRKVELATERSNRVTFSAATYKTITLLDSRVS